MSISREDHLERFQILSPFEIGTILQNILKRKQLLHMHFEHKVETAITALLDVDVKNRQIVMDQARLDGGFAARGFIGSKVSFETVLDRILISFSSDRLQPCLFENAPALTMPFPGELMRFEKRETFRVPVKNGSIRIPAPIESGKSPVTAEVRDISVNGICVIDVDSRIGGTAGEVFQSCTLYLPDIQPLETGLEIRSVQPIKTQSGHDRLRLGCRFLGLTSAKEALLQRFVLKQERLYSRKEDE